MSLASYLLILVGTLTWRKKHWYLILGSDLVDGNGRNTILASVALQCPWLSFSNGDICTTVHVLWLGGVRWSPKALTR